jgi:hypothetical protein
VDTHTEGDRPGGDKEHERHSIEGATHELPGRRGADAGGTALRAASGGIQVRGGLGRELIGENALAAQPPTSAVPA